MTVEDEIVEAFRKEVRKALRSRRMVEFVVDPWLKPHPAGAYVNVMWRTDGYSTTFEPESSSRKPRRRKS